VIDGARTIVALATVEVFRRFAWMTLRLENEHRHNCEKYRVVREIALLVASSSGGVPRSQRAINLPVVAAMASE
jgi:hypothetical protein